MKKPHSDPSYDADLARIRADVISMGSLAGEQLAGSLRALAARDAAAGRQVAQRDREVNAFEVEIDERCLKLLARWQPVASDLRFVGATLKMVTDLERIGDHCVNICERVMELGSDGVTPAVDLGALAEAVPALLRDALDAWRSEDAQMAGQVIERGPRVDGLVRQVTRACFEASRQDPRTVTGVIRWHEVAGYLHRIGAHATNIAEMVIFMVRGEDVRHAGRLPSPGPSARGL